MSRLIIASPAQSDSLCAGPGSTFGAGHLDAVQTMRIAVAQPEGSDPWDAVRNL
jgi:hypothetical protein